jgi:membrane-bound acyltransferase YfiQ involved in biofilm formation
MSDLKNLVTVLFHSYNRIKQYIFISAINTLSNLTEAFSRYISGKHYTTERKGFPECRKVLLCNWMFFFALNYYLHSRHNVPPADRPA